MPRTSPVKKPAKKRTTIGNQIVTRLKQLSADLKADRIPTPKLPRMATASVRREKVIDVAARLQAFERKLKAGKPVKVTTLIREPAYVIKPLKWLDLSYCMDIAHTPMGIIAIHEMGRDAAGKNWQARINTNAGEWTLDIHRQSREAAKKACESWYRQQLRKALIAVND